MSSGVKQLQTELLYTSISSNRNENNISCSGHHLLFSRGRRPIVYDVLRESLFEIDDTNASHKDDINGQCFVHSDKLRNSSENESHIITTSHDKTAKIWHYNLRGTSKVIFSLISPNNDTFISRSCLQHKARFISLTTTIEGDIHLWQDDELKQTLTTKYCCFYSKLTSAEYSQQEFTFAFLAGSDNRIHVFRIDLENLCLEHLFDLQGHNDWIKCIDIIPLRDGKNAEFLLASASQDTFVRVWLMRLDPEAIDRTRIRTIVSETLTTCPIGLRLTATLETVLSGHRGIIHSLCWFKRVKDNRLKLVTCSADKTVIVWESAIAKTLVSSVTRNEISNSIHKYEQLPASEGKWRELARFGETGETNLPFLGVCLNHDENIIFVQSLRGAIHTWKAYQDNQFVPLYSITGHFEPVTDLSWERSGKYLLTASQDKTCRLHSIASKDNRWHEIARPQVHGHELNCIATIDALRFATGAEEKVVRVFGSTKFFIKNYDVLAKEKLGVSPSILNEDELPDHAQLPALGLSIRGASSPYDVDSSMNDGNNPNKQKKKLDNTNEWHEVSKLVKEMSEVDHLESLPVEEILLQSTLWWERNKLFGHGNELHALAVDPSNEFLASASKANREDLAQVIVWDCDKFRKVSTITHHSLTVTRLKFSPNSKYLLSVSRDRTWCLSERNPTGQLRNAYKKYVGTTKHDAFHDRIIWDCSWTHDSMYFITVSRDKKAVLWSINDLRSNKFSETGEHEKLNHFSWRTFDSSIQAVDSQSFSRAGQPLGYLFAFGLENGAIELFHLTPMSQTNSNTEKCSWNSIGRLDNYHQLSIKRLAFRPDPKVELPEPDAPKILASGSDDCIVKLLQLSLPEI